MALNEIYKVASELVFPVADTVKSGDLVVVNGGIFGVAQQDAVTGEDGNTYATLKLDGVFKFGTSDEFDAGQIAYMLDANTVSADGVGGRRAIGYVHQIGTGHVTVRLTQGL